MRLVIREIHVSAGADALNDEWFIVENQSDRPFSTAGCTVLTGKGGGGKGRLRSIGTLDPGFMLQPGERVRLITGNPGRKAHGAVPDDGTRNYHLFLGSRVVQGPGTVIALALHQHEVARASYDPTSERGVAPPAEAQPGGGA